MINKFWFEGRNICCIKNGFQVVRDLNLKLKYNENVMLIGPNGSGKSSLIELINRNIYPVLNENTILKIFNDELINIWKLRKKISTVNQEVKTRINPNTRVIDLIISGLYGRFCKIPNTTENDISSVKALIKKINIVHLSERFYSHLSEGEKQIVLIARALINKPEILILDEPTNNLDLKSKFYVMDQIDKLSMSNTNIICITHDISMLTRIYDRIIMLKDRMIIADGKPKEVLNSKNINYLFDIDINLIEREGMWHICRKLK